MSMFQGIMSPTSSSSRKNRSFFGRRSNAPPAVADSLMKGSKTRSTTPRPDAHGRATPTKKRAKTLGPTDEASQLLDISSPPPPPPLKISSPLPEPVSDNSWPANTVPVQPRRRPAAFHERSYWEQSLGGDWENDKYNCTPPLAPVATGQSKQTLESIDLSLIAEELASRPKRKDYDFWQCQGLANEPTDGAVTPRSPTRTGTRSPDIRHSIVKVENSPLSAQDPSLPWTYLPSREAPKPSRLGQSSLSFRPKPIPQDRAESVKTSTGQASPATTSNRTTFYASSSESDTEQDASVNESTRSSSTSYGAHVAAEADGQYADLKGSPRNSSHRRNVSFSRPDAYAGSRTIASPFDGQVSEYKSALSTLSKNRENNEQLFAIKEDVAHSSSPPATPTTAQSFHKRNHNSRARNFSRPSLSDVPQIPSPRAFSESSTNSKTTSILQLSAADRTSARPLTLALTGASEVQVSARAAEDIVTKILHDIGDLPSLFACARANKAFYSVFKRHELRFMKKALRNASPAAWEYREASPKAIIAGLGTGVSEYTPTTFVQFQKRDRYVLSSLKAAMRRRCQSCLRPATLNALWNPGLSPSRRVDEALWRIWTFCTIFGNGTDREHDIIGQVDWLQGGILAHQSASVSTDRESEAMRASGVLLNPPDSFGRGNGDGLSPEDLEDIAEMWGCIKTLLQPLADLNLAKEFGIFSRVDDSTVMELGEQAVLKEWIHYIATLGLSAVSDLASSAESRPASAFEVAKDMDWTQWQLAKKGSRRHFLEEAAARLHKSEVAAAVQDTSNNTLRPTSVKAKRTSRGPEIARDLIREKKQSIDLLRSSYITEDQPLSLWLSYMSNFESGSKFADGPLTASTRDIGPPPAQAPPPTPPDAQRDISARGRSSSKSSTYRHRSPSASLSLFPPQYTRAATPTGSPSASRIPTPVATPARSRASSRSRPSSITDKHQKSDPRHEKKRSKASPVHTPTLTPMRSRTNSLNKEAADSVSAAESSVPADNPADKDKRGTLDVRQVFSPRLSICREERNRESIDKHR